MDAHRIAWFVVFGIAIAPGCREAGRISHAPPAHPLQPPITAASRQAQGPDGVGRVAQPDRGMGVAAAAPSPDDDPVEVLKRFASSLPVRVRAVAVVPAEALRRAVRDLAAAIPVPLVLHDTKEIAARVKALYGLDLSRPGPWCLVAWLELDGPALVCEGGGQGGGTAPIALERPPGAAGWNGWDFRGHRVARAGVIAAAGGGLVAIGSEAAVRRIAMVRGGAWPSLASAMTRVEAEIRRAGRGGEGAEVSLWFLDPAAAPWCLPGICEATAAFASREGMRVTAVARPGMGAVLQSTLEVLWRREVVEPFGRLTMPDAVAKPADLLVQKAAVDLRDPLVTLRAAPGDPVFLAAALHPDLVLRLLGPPE